MRYLAIALIALSLSGCTAITDILTAPTPSDINVYIAQLEVAQTNLNNSVLSLTQAGYIKKDSTTARTISLILAGANSAISAGEKDYVAGDTQSALLAFNTAKAAYDAVQKQLSNIKQS